MSVLVLAHLLFSDSIRLSAFSACISPGFPIRFIHSRGLVSDIENRLLSLLSVPPWMELPHLSFDGKAKLSNQLTPSLIRTRYI